MDDNATDTQDNDETKPVEESRDTADTMSPEDYVKSLDAQAGSDASPDMPDLDALRHDNDTLRAQLKAVSDAYVNLRRGQASGQGPKPAASGIDIDADAIIKATRPTFGRAL